MKNLQKDSKNVAPNADAPAKKEKVAKNTKKKNPALRFGKNKNFNPAYAGFFYGHPRPPITPVAAAAYLAVAQA